VAKYLKQDSLAISQILGYSIASLSLAFMARSWYDTFKVAYIMVQLLLTIVISWSGNTTSRPQQNATILTG